MESTIYDVGKFSQFFEWRFKSDFSRALAPFWKTLLVWSSTWLEDERRKDRRKKTNGTNHNMLPWHAWMDKNQFDWKQIETKVVPFPPFPQYIYLDSKLLCTLDSEINVAPGTFGKNIKRSPWNRHPPYHQTEDILKKKMCITLSNKERSP